MKVLYSQLAGETGAGSPDYWQYFGRRLVELAEISYGAAVLDIGTGPGSVLFPAAEKARDHGLVIGVDLDIDWCERVRAEIQPGGVRATGLAQMDASHLGIQDGTFDRVLCGFLGWDYCFDFITFEFTQPDTRLREIRRVLKPGGRVGISAWEQQEDLDWLGVLFRQAFPGYVAGWEELNGCLTPVYSQENEAGLERILREGKCQDIQIISETVDLVSRDAAEWWGQVWGAGWWEHIERVRQAEAGKMAWFKDQVCEELGAREQRDGLHFTKTVLFAFGKK